MVITAERVCKTLEGICLVAEFDDPRLADPATKLREFSSLVYRFCHVARATCKNPHEDWVEAYLKMETEINEALMSPNERENQRKAVLSKIATQIEMAHGQKS